MVENGRCELKANLAIPSEAALQHFTSAKQFVALAAAPELASEAAELLDESEQAKLANAELGAS